MKYIYSPKVVVESFVNVNDNHRKFYTVQTDANNNRVTCTWGRIGGTAKRRVYKFSNREETRAFADKIVEKRFKNGYVQVDGFVAAPAA